MELQNYTEWVIWCKANPKDKATQAFREYGKCIFEGKRAKVTQHNDNQEGSSGGKHVTRARGWWKRGDVDACAAQTNMQCWVSQGMIFDDEQAETHLREAWEHDSVHVILATQLPFVFPCYVHVILATQLPFPSRSAVLSLAPCSTTFNSSLPLFRHERASANSAPPWVCRVFLFFKAPALHFKGGNGGLQIPDIQ
jgi:hypothetical protein